MNAQVVETLPAGREEPQSMLQVIAKAASDPACDVQKMQALLDMQDRLLARDARMAFTRDFVAMQIELPIINARGEITNRSNEVQSRYAKWEDFNTVIKPILARFNFVLSFRTESEGEKLKTTAVLMHAQGHSEDSSITLAADTSGSKNGVQALGSSGSYGKRYTAFPLLNITVHGEDDDGQAGGTKRISAEQIAEIRKLIVEAKTTEEKFLHTINTKKLDLIPVASFDMAKSFLTAKIESSQRRAS